jgi:hypothetical protein
MIVSATPEATVLQAPGVTGKPPFAPATTVTTPDASTSTPRTPDPAPPVGSLKKVEKTRDCPPSSTRVTKPTQRPWVMYCVWKASGVTGYVGELV